MELEMAGIAATTNRSCSISAVMPPSHDSGPDRLIWKWMSKGKFSSASTYSYFLNQRELVQWEHSSRIWKNDAPQITNEHGNDFIFKGASYSNMDLIATSIAWARSISNLARLNNSCCSEYTKEYWQPPPVGWVKGNIDGSIPKHTSSAAVGGMIRDHEGNWLFGFGMRIGRYGIIQTEARALYEGLVAAWHEGFRQIEVESDNAILIDVGAKQGCGLHSKDVKWRFE
ncbi:hypothetical protein Golob_005325 [Gossypium lobatum]|uniref:RNase H type-1 domain-containing protein n=1 Tax=Gossypium lobatum TaxID=34289 RepID=A0A7J8MT23_9ROSI|nr:hypothetical protein [Gossypium lobatum]